MTGGAGFIGSNFIRYLLAKEEAAIVINLDKLTYAGNTVTVEDIEVEYPDRYEFVKGDICDRELVEGVFQQKDPDVVVNFAAESHVDRSFNNPTGFIKTNVEGPATLLGAARDHWVSELSDKKFLQMSTDKVYGSLSAEAPKFTEEAQLSPSSPYAASKASAEHIVKSFRKTYDLPILITRLSNVFGPYQYPEKLIPLMVHRASANERIPIYGDGTNKREWIYVKDVCGALSAVIEEGKLGETYNIGSGKEISNLKLVKKILDYLGKSEDLIYHTEDRLVHDNRCALDTTKVDEETGWTSQFEFEDKLKETINWYLDNPEWVKAVTGSKYDQWIKTNYDDLARKD